MILTSANIKILLQSANCCASKMGQQYIDKLSKGETCNEILEDAVLMTNLIDAICGIIPEGDLISGEQAKYTITVADVGDTTLDMVVTLTIGAVSYLTTIADPARTNENVATFIANFINSFNPQSYSYTALANDADVTISGSNFDADNGTEITVIVDNGSITTPSPVELSGGTTPVYQGKNNLTNGDLQVIIDRLNKLCSIECKNIFS